MEKKIRNQLIFGKQPVKEALSSGQELEKIFISQSLKTTYFKDILPDVKSKEVPVQFVPTIKLDKLAGPNHQGVVAMVSLIEHFSIQDILDQVFAQGEVPLFVMLDGVTDVRNIGAIARTALGMHAHALIIPNTHSATISGEAIKASAGALNHLPVCRVKNLRIAAKDLKMNGFFLAGMDGHAEHTIEKIPYEEPLCLIMGSEDQGIHPDIKKELDGIYKIIMHPKLESLNVSVATGMALYEIAKGRISLE
ncbi:MAG: 23S rRNA (guanosine(2251)-2'-O)-methyltransferase RlmB [Chitinophagales bacterium]|nr:23S rRNA (guanosine(2251)-2'-O)-methyltransferase RlmB [Chitinophagales bacterium]